MEKIGLITEDWTARLLLISHTEFVDGGLYHVWSPSRLAFGTTTVSSSVRKAILTGRLENIHPLLAGLAEKQPLSVVIPRGQPLI